MKELSRAFWLMIGKKKGNNKLWRDIKNKVASQMTRRTSFSQQLA
jgi:hypothetical protein